MPPNDLLYRSSFTNASYTTTTLAFPVDCLYHVIITCTSNFKLVEFFFFPTIYVGFFLYIQLSAKLLEHNICLVFHSRLFKIFFWHDM